MSMSYMITNEKFIEILNEYDELPFYNLPKWMRDQLRVRNIDFERRNPTHWEMKETEYDALEHRMHRNEMTAKDLIKVYQHKKENKYV